MLVTRHDRGQLRPLTKLDNGWVRCDAYVTRAGIFEYRTPDGSVRREYRPPEEVFAPESLATLQMVPVTLLHPPVELLTADNVKQYQVGSVGETITPDGHLVAAPLIVTDAAAVDALLSSRAEETSCGYECKLDETPGVSPEGEPYDVIQRQIRYNHVALVPRGRAGPDVRVRVDSKPLVEGVFVGSRHDSGGTVKKQFRIDSITLEVEESQAAALESLLGMLQSSRSKSAELQTSLDTASKSIETLQAKNDSLEQQLKDEKKARSDAEDVKRLDARVAARVDLFTRAQRVLGTTVKLDGKSDIEIKREVVLKLAPETKLDGKSDVYVEARFDAEFERFDASNPALEAARAAAGGSGAGARGVAADPSAARQRMIQRYDSAEAK